MILVRQYRDEDRAKLKQCFIELQDFEHRIEPRRKPGDEIVDRYLKKLFLQCSYSGGAIFVATLEENVIGFACVFPRESLDAELNSTYQVAYLVDLIVNEKHRRQNAGELLMKTAESYAKEQGASSMVLNVLCANVVARKFYASMGYEEYELKLEKRL